MTKLTLDPGSFMFVERCRGNMAETTRFIEGVGESCGYKAYEIEALNEDGVRGRVQFAVASDYLGFEAVNMAWKAGVIPRTHQPDFDSFRLIGYSDHLVHLWKVGLDIFWGDAR